MPYIPPADRKKICDGAIIRIGEAVASEGTLNFAITTLVTAFLGEHGLSYRNINGVVGALECAKMELYRRVAAPYENTKIEHHGDVYDSRLIKPADAHR